MKILLPVDGSPFTRRMLDYLARHRDLFGPAPDYVAFTAVAEVPPVSAALLDRVALKAYYEEHAQGVLRSVMAFAEEHGMPIRTRHAAGPAAIGIVHAAEDEAADVIVMGAHGHTALGNLLLGSVTSAVLARCKRPVLVIR